jgi:hypothetical protein
MHAALGPARLEPPRDEEPDPPPTAPGPGNATATRASRTAVWTLVATSVCGILLVAFVLTGSGALLIPMLAALVVVLVRHRRAG